MKDKKRNHRLYGVFCGITLCGILNMSLVILLIQGVIPISRAAQIITTGVQAIIEIFIGGFGSVIVKDLTETNNPGLSQSDVVN